MGSGFKVQRFRVESYNNLILLIKLIKIRNTNIYHWVKRLYKQDEDRIPLICAVCFFSTQNVEP